MVTMMSRWSSRVTLTGAAAAGSPVTSAPINSETSKSVLMTSFLRSSGYRVRPDFGYWRGRPENWTEVPRRVGRAGRGTSSAGDLQDHADTRRELGRLVGRLPSAEPRELTHELRVDFARHHQLHELILIRGAVRAIALRAEPRGEL